MSGKGSGRRPAKVDRAHVSDNWDRIFGKKKSFCYCAIGAGGKPCVSREFCDAKRQKEFCDAKRQKRCDQCKAEVIGIGAGDEVVDYCPECEQIVEGNTHRS